MDKDMFSFLNVLDCHKKTCHKLQLQWLIYMEKQNGENGDLSTPYIKSTQFWFGP